MRELRLATGARLPSDIVRVQRRCRWRAWNSPAAAVQAQILGEESYRWRRYRWLGGLAEPRICDMFEGAMIEYCMKCVVKSTIGAMTLNRYDR